MPHDPPANRLPEKVRVAIENHFARARSGLIAVSIKNTVRAIRSTAPDCTLPDDILGDAVARHAIDKGYSVHFDIKDRLVPVDW